MFKVSFSNVPVLNLRWEFREFYEKAHSPHFLIQPDRIVRPLQTRYFLWAGMPDAGATMMVGRAISGVESYLCYAVEHAAASRGKLTARIQAAARNPFVLGGGAADNYFNRLPALVADDIAMKRARPSLWSATLAFYHQVRNPVFHGKEFRDLGNHEFGTLFDHIADVYDWIDGWCDPEEVMPGARQAFAVQRSAPAT